MNPWPWPRVFAHRCGGSLAPENTLEGLEVAARYASEREQFGRPVASFQSIKHKLVDMYGELQTAYSAVLAAINTAMDDPAWAFAVSAAERFRCPACGRS